MTIGLLRASAVLTLALLSVAAAENDADAKLGTIHFEAAGNAEAVTHVTRGVLLLHHMMYVEADREFSAALQSDPSCAIAYWGRAMTFVHPLWPDEPDASELKQGGEWISRGLELAAEKSRERAYLEAMVAYYRETTASTQASRLTAADVAWTQLADLYPEDLDAAAFSALFHLAPIRFLPKDKSHRIQFEAIQRINAVLAKIPDHPGAQHYKIHALDFPLLADGALEVCDSYGAIAPEVPHALHMPTHIFTRRGQWDRSIEYNERAAQAALKLDQRMGATDSHLPHALDYLTYAYLQRGQYQKANEIRRRVQSMPGPYGKSNRSAMAYAFAAIPARVVLEQHDWAAAATLEPRQPASFAWGDGFLQCDAITAFARSLGAIRSGNVEAAERFIAVQKDLAERITTARPKSYWASQAETQLLTTRAWLALKKHNAEEALALMRRAANLEATVDKEAVTPGEVLPAAELLGEMLSELGRDREAMAAFETALQNGPNRLNGLFGAAKAAEAVGDRAKAKVFFEQLRAVTAQADQEIEPIRRAGPSSPRRRRVPDPCFDRGARSGTVTRPTGVAAGLCACRCERSVKS